MPRFSAAEPLGRGMFSPRPVQAPHDLGIGLEFDLPRDLCVWDQCSVDVDAPTAGVPMPTERHFTVPPGEDSP